MFTAEQVKAMISVVEMQRATASEYAIQLSVRVTELERKLAELTPGAAGPKSLAEPE